MSAIFRNVSQALHFAFVIEQYPATSFSTMPKILAKIREESGLFDAAPLSTIDLAGLTALEVRGQCADVRAAIRRHLSQIEAQVLEARYSHDRDTKRFAVRAIAQHFGPLIGVAGDCALALAWRHYMDKERRDRDFSLRAIGDEFGISKDRTHRAAKALAHLLGVIEASSEMRLSEPFEIAGIADSAPRMAA